MVAGAWREREVRSTVYAHVFQGKGATVARLMLQNVCSQELKMDGRPKQGARPRKSWRESWAISGMFEIDPDLVELLRLEIPSGHIDPKTFKDWKQ